ncbi:MAG: hypothetical protein ACOC9T_00485 [Myxococcota bacterium]
MVLRGMWLAAASAAVLGCSSAERGPSGAGMDQDGGADGASSADAGEAPADAGPDDCCTDEFDASHPDAGDSGGEDAGSGAGSDAGADTGPPDDAAPACSCSTIGECCDGCDPINEGDECSDPVAGTGGEAVCSSGECVGETCECSAGECCDGCFFLDDSVQCATEVTYDSECSSPSEACPGYFDRIRNHIGNIYCPGDAPDCSGEIDHVRTVAPQCYTQEHPVFCVETDAGAACAHTCS